MPTRENLKDYINIILGTMLVAIGVSVFFEPCNLVTGGVTGLAIIIADFGERYFDVTIPLWVTNIVLNIPLLALGYKVNGRGFLARTLFATVFLSVALSAAAYIPKFSQEDLMISAIFGAVFNGIGMGMVFRSKTTTGGTDIAASVIHAKLRHISVAKILFAVDSAVILLGLFAFGAKSAMYAIVSVYIGSLVIDTYLEGLNFAKAAFIISDHSREIANQIMDITERGATSLFAKGVYTGNEKDVLLIVMSNKQIVLMKDVVKNIDPNAFVIVTDVREVLGEGFQIMQ